MKKAVVWITLVFALGLSIGFYFNRSREVNAGEAVLHQFTTFIEGAGVLTAPTQVVFAPSDGVIGEICVEKGDVIKAGEPLLQMEDTALRLQLEEAVLALNVQKKAYRERHKALSRSEEEAALLTARAAGYDLEGFNAAVKGQGEVDAGEEQVEIARLQVRKIRELIRHATVNGAIGGTVLEVNFRNGEQVNAGTRVALLAAMDEVEIEAGFADQDASTIVPGMEVELYGGCLGAETCGGTVTGISLTAAPDAQQRSTAGGAVVMIKPVDCGAFNRLGASVELKIITGRKRAVGVPIEALAQDAAGLYVYVVRRGRAYRVPVNVGVLDETHAEIKSGVAEGDVVALNPTELRNGQKVSMP